MKLLLYLFLLFPLLSQAKEENTKTQIEVKKKKPRALKYLETGGERKLEVLYKTINNKKLFLDIYYPTDKRQEKSPIVIYTHGGGWAAGSKMGAGRASFAAVFSQLVKEGFCVVSVQYRLYKKGGVVSMRDCVTDAKDAIRYLSKNSDELALDAMRIYTMGDSAGGQMSQMLLLSPPDSLPGLPELAKEQYKTIAGVSWYGPCDFEKESLFNHNDRKNFRDRFGPRILPPNSKPEDKLKLYREMSSINYLEPNSPPLLMIQGDKDTTIPVKHAYHMQEKAEKINAPVEILIVKNAGHNWRSVDAPTAPTRNEIVEKTVNFFLENLK
ncbi:MAG: alpha/beta hydrolase [Lentisphaeraceae bacterium]|nr:alpha/beta hydrolase [Lentisphaeraceae bacterium]